MFKKKITRHPKTVNIINRLIVAGKQIRYPINKINSSKALQGSAIPNARCPLKKIVAL
jgi:hypothetical protein